MCVVPAPQISLLELIKSCGLDLDCLRISILSFAHRAQFWGSKCFHCANWVALPDDAAGCSSMGMDWHH